MCADAGAPPVSTSAAGTMPAMGKAKRKRSKKHKRGSSSNKIRHDVVQEDQAGQVTAAVGRSGGSAVAAAVTPAAAPREATSGRAAPATKQPPTPGRAGSSLRTQKSGKYNRIGTHKRGSRSPKQQLVDSMERAAASAATLNACAAAAATVDNGARVAVLAEALEDPVAKGSLPVVNSGVPGTPAPASSGAVPQDSSSDTESILAEGRLGMADMNIGTASSSVIKAAINCALTRPGVMGVLSLSGIMDEGALRATRLGVSRVTSAMAVPIFNTQSVAEMMRAKRDGEPVDEQRRPAVMSARWASTALDRSSLAHLCDILFHNYGRRYISSEPKVLLTSPRAKPQMVHGDAAAKEKLGNPPRMIGVVMAVEDGAHLDTWPGSFCNRVLPGEEQCVVRTSLAERVLGPV